MKFIIAHDVGTSGNKAALFAEDGRMIDSAVVSYGTNYFNGTWVEQDAEDWWNAVCQSTKDLLRATGTDPRDIAVISFSGQMMGCLCVDRQGKPLRPSIIWADQRALEQAEQLRRRISQWDFYNIVGHSNTASYGIQKLMWVRDNEPEVYANTYKTLNAKDFIVLRLTGNFCTDYSDGNSNGCYDIKRFCWSEEILTHAGIDPDKLPDLHPSTFVAGAVTEAAARACGLAPGTPVVLGAGDGVTASVGAGSVSPGKTYCSMGTSAWVTTASEQPIFDTQMRTVNWAHAVPGLYAPNGTMQYAGGAYSWLKNTVCTMESHLAEQAGTSPYTLMNDQLAASPAGANGLIFLPYLLGERAPRWDPFAKGAYIGLKPETSRGDMLRAVLEGITMNLAIVLDILRTGMNISEITVLGGGAKSRVWQQIMADIYNAKVLVPGVLEEAGSMGAAVIGGVGAGLFKDFTAVDRFIEIRDTKTPGPGAAAAYELPKKHFEQCYAALKPVFEDMAKQPV